MLEKLASFNHPDRRRRIDFLTDTCGCENRRIAEWGAVLAALPYAMECVSLYPALLLGQLAGGHVGYAAAPGSAGDDPWRQSARAARGI